MQRLYARRRDGAGVVRPGDARGENEWSLGYLTIVGAYVLKGDRYDVSTLVDLAVVDPVSRSLVLRAGGVDMRHGNATLIDRAARGAREAAPSGFSAAADQMIGHFDTALNEFEAEVRAGHANVHVVHKDGSGRGRRRDGLAELGFLALLVALRAALQAPERCAVLPL